MAGILSNIVAGTKAGSKEIASNVMESVYSAGLFGSVLKSVVTQFAEDKPQARKVEYSYKSAAQTLVSLEKYFAQISDNVYNIAATLGAQVTSMHEIEQMLVEDEQNAKRAGEEAATEDAKVVPPSDPFAGATVKATDDTAGPLNNILKMFKGKSLSEIVVGFATGIGKAVAGFGVRLLALLNPVGMAAGIVSAIGYGVFQYFTNDEFKGIVDTGISSLWSFAKDAVQSIIDFFPKLVAGGMEFLSGLWDTISNWASKTVESVKSGIKSFFGFGEKKTAPAPVAQEPSYSSPTPTTSATTPSVAPQTTAAAKSTEPPTSASSSVSMAHAQAMPTPTTASQATPTALGDASQIDSLVNKADSGVDISGLVGAFKARLAGLAADFKEMTGKKLLVTSGYRSPEKQRALYERDPAHAAKPGNSPHEVGTAVDITSADANLADSLGLFRKYGLIRPLAQRPQNPEPWHVEPIERKAIAYGDGGVVAGSGNARAVDPGSGKPIPVPPTPQTGTVLTAASETNQQTLERRQKQPQNISIDNSVVQFRTVSLTSFMPSASCEPRSLSALGA